MVTLTMRQKASQGWQPGQPLQSQFPPGSLMTLMVSWTAELVSRRGNLHESVRRFETESPLKYDEGPFTWIQMGSNEPPDSWLDLWVGKPTRFFQGPFGPWDISKRRQGKIIENWFTCATTLTEAPAGAKAAKKQKEHGSRKHKK